MLIKNELLGYPRIEIFQDSDLYSFNTDTILLSSFVRVGNKTKKIIDLGAGNGAIPLYLSLKTKSPIYAIEIQENIFELLDKNIKHNHLENQIIPVLADIKGISKKLGMQSFDVVVSNPPFFKKDEHTKVNKNESIMIARHEILIDLEGIIKEASMLLNNKGGFYMVHRPDRLTEIINLMSKYNLVPKRLRFVQPRRTSKPNHVLIEAIKNGSEGGLNVLSPLVIYNGDKWTKEVLKIYNIGSDLNVVEPVKS